MKTHLYNDGDLNTKFFHVSATSCKKLNWILSLENDVGDRVFDEQGMCQIAKGYFEDLFPDNHNSCALVIEVIKQVVYEKDNDFLIAPSQV